MFIWINQGQRVKVTNQDGVTIYYPTKFYNTQGTNKTKHIFANDLNIATIEGTGINAKIYYNTTDLLNSSSVMTNNNGTIEQVLDYFPYGKIRIDKKTGSFSEQRKYIGEEYDQETGLNYLNARYYNSVIGRFISQDSVFLAIGDSDKIQNITGQPLNQVLSDPQQINSYSYGRNNPIVMSDPGGELVELAARPVALGGQHLFYQITPDNPNQINISGLASGTTQFTIGAYNRGGFLGIGNKLVPEIGSINGIHNTDTPYLKGEKQITDKIIITPPNGQSDSQFINSLGKAFNDIVTENGSIDYFTAGQMGMFGYANSNNFVHELGSRVGVADQITNFNPQGYNFAPGLTRGLSTTSYTQYFGAKLDALQNRLIVLQKLISSKFGN